MGEKMKTHPTMATAVAAAQLEMSNALKDSSNSHFRNQYASLASVRDVVVRAYAANGVAVVQEVIGCDGQAGVKTTLYWQGDPDKPRESMPAGDLMTPIGSGRNTPQECGSLTTYYRRYMLAAAGGIAQEDDDAQSQQAPPKRAPAARKPSPPAQPAATMPPCPVCGGRVVDNRMRASKARANGDRAPWFFCSRNADCPGGQGQFGWAEFNNADWHEKADKAVTK